MVDKEDKEEDKVVKEDEDIEDLKMMNKNKNKLKFKNVKILLNYKKVLLLIFKI